MSTWKGLCMKGTKLGNSHPDASSFGIPGTPGLINGSKWMMGGSKGI